MGGDRVTVRNLRVVQVDAGEHVVVVKGAVPGAPGGYVMVRKAIAGGWVAASEAEERKE